MPTLIVDAGTGIRQVTSLMKGQAFRGTILLGHLHWDHVEGLPFFSAGDNDDSIVRLVMPQQGDAEEVLARMMSPPFFPVSPAEMRGEWTFEGIEPGDYDIEGFHVKAVEIPHKGGRCFGYRISDGNKVIVYISDHSPTARGPGEGGLGMIYDDVLDLACGADVLLHDSQHTAREFPPVAHFGHATIEYSVALARAAGVKRLLLFHHSPGRTDEQLEAIVSSVDGDGLVVEAAAEGTAIDL